MKLRIRGDSIRLRLRKLEVRQLLDAGFVAETTAFGPASEFRYRIETGGDRVQASFDFIELRVLMPKDIVERWANTDQISISVDQPVGDGRRLRILIEKDFACRDGDSDESQDGAFEGPV